MAFLLFKATSLKKVCFQLVLQVSCCNGVCVSAGAGAVVVWWLDRHRAAGFTATVRRPEQRDGRLQCVTEPEGQVAYGSSTALQTQTPPPAISDRATIQPWPLEDTTHPISLNGPTANIVPWQINIYTQFISTFDAEWRKKKRCFFKTNTIV